MLLYYLNDLLHGHLFNSFVHYVLHLILIRVEVELEKVCQGCLRIVHKVGLGGSKSTTAIIKIRETKV